MIPSRMEIGASARPAANPWQDRGGIIRKIACPDCGQSYPAHRTTSGEDDHCPRCRSLLGCLIDRGDESGEDVRQILDIMVLAAAFALGYTSSLALWAQHRLGHL